MIYGLVIRKPHNICETREVFVQHPSLITDLVIENDGFVYHAPIVLQPTHDRDVYVSASDEEICLTVEKKGKKVAELKYCQVPGLKNPVPLLSYEWHNEWDSIVINCHVSDSDTEKIELFCQQFNFKLLTKINKEGKNKDQIEYILVCGNTNRLCLAYLKEKSISCTYAQTPVALSDSAISNLQDCFLLDGTLTIKTLLDRIEIKTKIDYFSCYMKTDK